MAYSSMPGATGQRRISYVSQLLLVLPGVSLRYLFFRWSFAGKRDTEFHVIARTLICMIQTHRLLHESRPEHNTLKILLKLLYTVASVA
jgi:hypothetical protein